MQSQDFREDPSSAEGVLSEDGHDDTLVESTRPFEPPRIPVGLPHVVQFVEGSLYHLPQTIQNVGSKMSRYADKDGVASIALPFLCEVAGLGSKNTAEHCIHVMASMGVLEKHPGKGGKDRKSNSYTFLGAGRDWRPLPAERRGTDPWIALSQSRRENETLRAELEEIKAQMALLTNGHSPVTDGEGPSATNSYESEDSSGNGGANGHSGVTDGQEANTPETASHSYETPDVDISPGESGAIGHSKVTDGLVDGHAYLARRARVEKLVLDHQNHYRRSFRGGVPSAVHYFSQTPETEQELLLQVDTLTADQAAEASAESPPQDPEQTPSVRRGVEYCPDCGNPYTTHDGAEYCPECTEHRNRGGGD